MLFATHQRLAFDRVTIRLILLDLLRASYFVVGSHEFPGEDPFGE